MPLWPSPRCFALVAASAVVLACAPLAAVLAWCAGGMLVVLVAATVLDARSGPVPGAVLVERAFPERITLGTPVRVAYRIANPTAVGVRIAIFEAPMRTLAMPVEALRVEIAARGEVTVWSEIATVARGRDRSGPLAVWCENPFGLLRRRWRVEAAQAIRVLPDLAAIERSGRLQLPQRAREAGLRRMRRRGAGSEVGTLREFTAGDAFRAVNWKASARRGKLIVTDRESERGQNVLILIDCGRMMTARAEAGLRVLDYAVTAALSLAAVVASTDDRVGMIAFAREILVATVPRRMRGGLARFTDTLADVEPRFEESDFSAAFWRARRVLRKRSLIVILSDAIGALTSPALSAELQALAHHHRVLVAATADGAVAQALAVEPVDLDQAYRAAAALALAEDRRSALGRLERTGVSTIDVPAPQLAAAAIERYLRIKERGLL